MSDIRKLIGNAATSAQRTRDMAKAEFDANIIALLAAIARLEQKAATAKAECEAWREHKAAHDAYNKEHGPRGGTEQELSERCGDAETALRKAIAATDEAWREQAKEPKP